MKIPAETIYPQIGAKVGLLDEEAAQATVQFYDALAALRSSVNVQMPELESSGGGSGFYSIVGGEKVASALYQSERLIPNVVDLGSLTIVALEKDAESRVMRSKDIFQRT